MYTYTQYYDSERSVYEEPEMYYTPSSPHGLQAKCVASSHAHLPFNRMYDRQETRLRHVASSKQHTSNRRNPVRHARK